MAVDPLNEQVKSGLSVEEYFSTNEYVWIFVFIDVSELQLLYLVFIATFLIINDFKKKNKIVNQLICILFKLL